MNRARSKTVTISQAEYTALHFILRTARIFHSRWTEDRNARDTTDAAHWYLKAVLEHERILDLEDQR
jgi:hypothetical protein